VYVSNVSVVFKRMLQVFHLNVAYVAVSIHVVESVFSKCLSYFIWMLHVFIWMLHVFHLDVACVARVIHVCCKRMFQIFDVACVARVIHVCCKRMFQIFHLFQTNVVSI